MARLRLFDHFVGADEKRAVAPFIDKIPTQATRIIEHPSEIGVGLPHVGMLVGRATYARLWPQIVAWLKARS